MDSAVLWYSSRATGAVSLILFTAVVVLGMATAGRASSVRLSRAAVLRLHRYLSLTAVVFLVVHIGTAVLDNFVDIDLIDVVVPFAAGYSPLWVGLGTVAVDLVIAIGVTSLARRRLPVVVWRLLHLSAYLLWPMALLHGWFTGGGDASTRWMQAIDIVCVAAVAVAALRWRLRRDRHPDSVARLAADRIHAPVGGGSR